MKKYYNRPNELFARFIESLTIDYEYTKKGDKYEQKMQKKTKKSADMP